MPKQTRGWDDQAQVTRAQRHKEESSDYRYFPDPDLVPVACHAEQVEQVAAHWVNCPPRCATRLQTDYELEAYDADVLVNQGRAVVEYFETVAERCGDPKRASNWIQQDVLRTLNEQEICIESFPVSAEVAGRVADRSETGDLDKSRAKDVFQQWCETGDSVDAAMKQLGIEGVGDRSTGGTLPRTARAEPADRRGCEERQAAGDRCLDRSGTKTQPQCQSRPSSRDLSGTDCQILDDLRVIALQRSCDLITFTTDFGEGSPYIAQMKAAALSINRQLRLFDITHAIAAQDVRQAALTLVDVAMRFPDDTIHVCVVDPGVGTHARSSMPNSEINISLRPTTAC